MAHTIEVAKSSRAACRTCRGNIAKGELRFGEESMNQFAPGGETSYRWHHLACAADKLPAELDAALAAYGGEVPDRAQVEARIARALAAGGGRPAGFPHADRAPTGRARCLACQQPIAKDSLRVAIERELDTGMYVSRGAGYLHPGCVRAHAAAGGDHVERTIAEVRANSRLPADEIDEVARAIAAGADGDATHSGP